MIAGRQRIVVENLDYPALRTIVEADGAGAFGAELPAGRYALWPDLEGQQDTVVANLVVDGMAEVTIPVRAREDKAFAPGPADTVTVGQGICQGAWHSLNSMDGLPGGFVQALAQDDAGGIWIGTDSGLCLFDGRHFSCYSSAHGLPDDGVTALLTDRHGRLWIGTAAGLYRYDGKHLTACCRTGMAASGLPPKQGCAGTTAMASPNSPTGMAWLVTICSPWPRITTATCGSAATAV